MGRAGGLARDKNSYRYGDDAAGEYGGERSPFGPECEYGESNVYQCKERNGKQEVDANPFGRAAEGEAEFVKGDQEIEERRHPSP